MQSFIKLVATFCAFCSIAAHAASTGKHSNVEATTQFSAGAKADAPGMLTVQFKVVPNSDMGINLEGPWSLEIKDAGGLTIETKKLARPQLNEQMPGFSVTASVPPQAQSGKLGYRLVSFICTKDKSVCYRDVHDGTAGWKR